MSVESPISQRLERLSELPQLERNMLERRALANTLFSALAWLAAILGSIPLLSVIYMLLLEGGARLSWETLSALPPAGFDTGGGFGNAIVGTLVMVGIAALLSIPFGLLAAIYLAVVGPTHRLAAVSRFVGKTLTGFPSILAGVFVYAILVINFGYSAIAGGVALAVLMLPTVMLAAEEALRQVPQKMTDAAYGMGCNRTQVIVKIVLPTALPGVITGVLLAVAGAAGESAPLLFTALFSNYYMSEVMEPTASLSILIYNFSAMPFENQIELAWGASLTLVLLVLTLNVLARLIGRPRI